MGNMKGIIQCDFIISFNVSAESIMTILIIIIFQHKRHILNMVSRFIRIKHHDHLNTRKISIFLDRDDIICFKRRRNFKLHGVSKVVDVFAISFRRRSYVGRSANLIRFITSSRIDHNRGKNTRSFIGCFYPSSFTNFSTRSIRFVLKTRYISIFRSTNEIRFIVLIQILNDQFSKTILINGRHDRYLKFIEILTNHCIASDIN